YTEEDTEKILQVFSKNNTKDKERLSKELGRPLGSLYQKYLYEVRKNSSSYPELISSYFSNWEIKTNSDLVKEFVGKGIMTANNLSLTLNKLVKQGKINKLTSGSYVLAKEEEEKPKKIK